MNTTATIEYDGSGAVMPRKPEKPAPPPKTGRYAILNAEDAYPRAYNGGMTTTAILFNALESIRATLFSERARLHATGKIDVGVYFGRIGGWAWIPSAPFPNIVHGLELRDGCPSCGSIGHVGCYLKVGSFTPDPPRPPEAAAVQSPQQRIASSPVPYIPSREVVSAEEQAEFDRIGREHPDLVAAARQSTATLTAAYRLAIKNLKHMEAAHASD
jgi:hypothetical protein